MIGLSQYDIMSGDGTRLGDGISKIFKPYKIRKIEDQFNDYLLHQLNVDRMARDKNFLKRRISSTNRNEWFVDQMRKNLTFFLFCDKMCLLAIHLSLECEEIICRISDMKIL